MDARTPQPPTNPPGTQQPRSAAPGRPPGRPFLLPALGIVLVAINLRPAAACLGPLLTRIESSTGISTGLAGLLTTLPVLCFGALAPAAPVLARRIGLAPALAASLWLLLAASILRVLPGVAFLFAGTALAGAAIALGNVLLPVFVRREVPERTSTAMALYGTSLIAFAAIAAALTVPIARALGGGWRAGLGVWAVLALLGGLGWSVAFVRPRARRHAEDASTSPAEPPGSTRRVTESESTRHVALSTLLRRRLAWQVTLFFAVQASLFYSTLAWLPSIFQSHGATPSHAGVLLGVCTGVGVIVAPGIPHLAARTRWQRRLAVACCALTAVGLLGILLAPRAAPYLWVVLLGVGENAVFPLALVIIVERGGDVAHTQALSAFAQSVGHVLAALGPLLVGAIHGATGTWTAPLILLLALLVPQLGLGLLAARPRSLATPVPASPGDEPSRVKQARNMSVHIG